MREWPRNDEALRFIRELRGRPQDYAVAYAVHLERRSSCAPERGKIPSFRANQIRFVLDDIYAKAERGAK